MQYLVIEIQDPDYLQSILNRIHDENPQYKIIQFVYNVGFMQPSFVILERK